MKCYFPGRDAVLIFDRLAVHLDVELVSLLLKNNIYCLFIPAKSSHLIQPLDQYVFANFKKVIRSKIFELNISNTPITEEKFDKIIMEAEIEAFKPNVVKKSFECVGLYPPNKKVMMEKVENFLKKKKKIILKINDNGLTSQIKQITKSIIEKHMSKEKETKVIKSRVIAKMGEVYTAEELLNRTKKKKRRSRTKKERSRRTEREEEEGERD